MKALVIEAPGRAVVKDVPYPEPGPGELTIKVENCGICGTDVHIYKGEYLSPYPLIPGHEFSGVIHGIGVGVTGWEIGDRVSADPNINCGACQYCHTQRANHCENWNAIGVTLNGAMAEYVRIPAREAVKIPEGMDFETAAFIEPMACVVHGMNRLQMKVADRVLLFGAGAMGQQLIQAVVRAGASEVVAVDISENKLNMARRFGATRVIESKYLDQELGTGKHRHVFDVVIDVTGIPKVIEKAIDYMGPAGKFLQFGVTGAEDMIQISPFKLFNRDWTLLGSMAVNYSFLPALHWLQEGRIDVKPIISKVISLEEAVEFFSQPPEPETMKVQIKI